MKQTKKRNKERGLMDIFKHSIIQVFRSYFAVYQKKKKGAVL